jgi:hypothetical protein
MIRQNHLNFTVISSVILIYLTLTQARVSSQDSVACNGVEIKSFNIETRKISPNQKTEQKIDLVSSKAYSYDRRKKVNIVRFYGPTFNDYRDSLFTTTNSFFCNKDGIGILMSVYRYQDGEKKDYLLGNWQPLITL